MTLVSTRGFAWENGSFRPNGPYERHAGALEHLHANRARWSSSDPMQAARLFVGFNVDDEPTYEMNDLMQVVSAARELQGRQPASSYVFQRGIYAHEGGGRVVSEDGAQVIILNTEFLPAAEFRQEMINVAEQIARQMEQEEVILELQKAGITQEVLGIGPT